MAEINVNIFDNGAQINVEVSGAGPAGKDGFSPTVETEAIENGTRVTITDKNGPKSFDVLNGKDGGSGGGGGGEYVIGDGLKLDEETNTLSVDTATSVEEDNTKPITSAAVFVTVGNIETILGTI